MKQNRDESFKGETWIKISEKMKTWGKNTHPVGALISPNQIPEWEELRAILEDECGIRMSKGGWGLIVKWAIKMLKASLPIAKSTGYNPADLTDSAVDGITKSMEDMDVEKWVDQSGNLRKEITKGMEAQILVNVRKKIQ